MTVDVKEFNVSIEDKEIVHGLNFSLAPGEVTVIMGPNGSGKSTLAQGLMGHPKYETTGHVMLDGVNLLDLEPNERATNGLFLSFQYPVEIEGVSVKQFLRQAVNAHRDNPIRISEFKKLLQENMELLHIDPSFAERYLNKGFSGGEKKKMEILQLLMLQPKVAILDETDSGLDVDALRKVCEGINIVKERNPEMSILLITHYQRILDYVTPDHVLILANGSIVKQGDKDLVAQIEKDGYEQFITK